MYSIVLKKKKRYTLVFVVFSRYTCEMYDISWVLLNRTSCQNIESEEVSILFITVFMWFMFRINTKSAENS